MNIAWGSLGLVAVVAFVAAVAVVVLVSFALVGLSARARAAQGTVGGPEDGAPPPLSASAGTAVALVCLVAVAAIVLYGLGIVTQLI